MPGGCTCLTGSQSSPELTCSMACVPLPQGHPDYLWPSVSFSKMLQVADVAEHSLIVVGSPEKSSSAVKRKGSHGSGTKERKQCKEG